MPEGLHIAHLPPAPAIGAESGPAARWTFSQRLALVYGAVSLVILLGAGAFTWWQAETLSARNEDLAIAETRRLAERVGSALEQARQGVSILAVADPMANGPGACSALLNAAHLTMEALVRHLFVVDAQHSVTCSTLPSMVGRQATQGVSRTAELTGRPVTGALVPSSFGAGQVIGVAHPIRRNGRHDAVVVAAVTVEGLREAIARYVPARDGLRVWLLDSAEASVGLVGTPDSLPVLPDALRASFNAPTPEDAGIAAAAGHVLIQARATDDLSLVASFPESAIRAGAPLEVALPPLLLALVLLAGMGALFWSVQRFVVAPLEAATRRLEAPDGTLPAEAADREAPSDVADLIRRLGATRATRDEAIHLRDLLLREAHHRIKNHLALVTSFLRLQERQLSDHAALQALRTAQGRMVAIGMTYELLHDGPGQRVALDTMLSRFARALEARDVTEGATAARVETDLAALEVPADVAVKIALVVNELATNALKYAFAGRGPGTVRITLRPAGEGGFTLRVADDGNGMPDELRRGLGMTVVDSLLRGIDATLEREPGPGTAFLITWLPRPSARPAS
ncbi:sensor histidine kinase [Roseomonas indoligenes]|uniref:histidine kinase n=1 Tax=Roseomonas indoligenes TaxID=2820811 RepID=A0A940MYT5_9PROT|nr:sensor histidine kinase [Pararoseomonas indoligenes]MBP0493682.1 sensor histidine kinase [Pararoseomonas indoligenes]